MESPGHAVTSQRQAKPGPLFSKRESPAGLCPTEAGKSFPDFRERYTDKTITCRKPAAIWTRFGGRGTPWMMRRSGRPGRLSGRCGSGLRLCSHLGPAGGIRGRAWSYPLSIVAAWELSGARCAHKGRKGGGLKNERVPYLAVTVLTLMDWRGRWRRRISDRACHGAGRFRRPKRRVHHRGINMASMRSMPRAELSRRLEVVSSTIGQGIGGHPRSRRPSRPKHRHHGSDWSSLVLASMQITMMRASPAGYATNVQYPNVHHLPSAANDSVAAGLAKYVNDQGYKRSASCLPRTTGGRHETGNYLAKLNNGPQ